MSKYLSEIYNNQANWSMWQKNLVFLVFWQIGDDD